MSRQLRLLQRQKTCSLRQARRLAKQLGIAVSAPRRTGELLFQHDTLGRVRCSASRKDASRALMRLLRAVAKLLELYSKPAVR